jgi:hypothetical protein
VISQDKRLFQTQREYDDTQAAFAGRISEVIRLFENGVKINAADFEGRTALVNSCYDKA